MSRETLAPLLIVATILGGGWMMLVEPSLQEISRLEIQLDELSGSTITTEQIGEVAERVNEVRARLEGVKAANQLASNSSELYALFRNLAKEHEVIVPRLQPGGASAPGQDENDVNVHRIDMVIEGSYQNVSAFLGAVDELPGFIRPTVLQVLPIDREGQRLISAQFSCEALQFDLEDDLALEGARANAGD